MEQRAQCYARMSIVESRQSSTKSNLFGLCLARRRKTKLNRAQTSSLDLPRCEPMEQREQYQTRLNIAESWQRWTKGQGGQRQLKSTTVKVNMCSSTSPSGSRPSLARVLPSPTSEIWGSSMPLSQNATHCVANQELDALPTAHACGRCRWGRDK